MHNEAYGWVAEHATGERVAVLDIGGRNINGSVKALFPAADPYLSLDLFEGPGVDIVADASTWQPDRLYDVVVCCEVFEHTDKWPAILRTAMKALCQGGLFVATMAGPGRPVHSGIDGAGRLLDGEHYANIIPELLESSLMDAGFRDIRIDVRKRPSDVRCVAWAPPGRILPPHVVFNAA